MQSSKQPLIVGAGPVGLAAALFLARAGIATRVVERRLEPAWESKALAINPRTLDILEPTGVTAKMRKRGLPILGACIHRRGRIIARVDFHDVHPRHPYMLALSQATTERLLTDALEALGGRVERGTTLTDCRVAAAVVEGVLERESVTGAKPEAVSCPWLLAADGARSTVRDRLRIAFEGSTFAEPWHLADLPLKTDLEPDRAHAVLLDDGFLFLLRVVDDALANRAEEPIWRVIGNQPEPLARLGVVRAEPAGPPIWESRFRVEHRINAVMAAEGVYFAGDAAHIHSPMGARGMNLGVEDAWIFSEAVRTGRMSDYSPLRLPVDARVVRQVERLSRIIASPRPTLLLLRNLLIPILVSIPSLRRRLIAPLTGLDHDLSRLGEK